MLVAPRIVNDVAYVTDITHESHFFAWQPQYLETLEGGYCCSIVNDIYMSRGSMMRVIFRGRSSNW